MGDVYLPEERERELREMHVRNKWKKWYPQLNRVS